MLKGNVVLRSVLLGTLVLGANALMSTTASATTAELALCARKFSGPSIAPFANSEQCDDDESGGGSPTGWAHIYPVSATEVLFCAEEAGKFKGPLCKSGEAAGGFESLFATLSLGALKGSNTTTSTLKGTIGGVATNISCSTSAFSIIPEESGKQSGGEINYTGCTVNKPAKCIVKEPITATFNGQAEREAAKFIDKFSGSGASEKFVEIEFKNKSTEKCSIENGTKAAVTGSQTCEFGAGITMMKTTQEVICKESGSKLKFGGEAATYAGNDTVEGSNKENLGALETEI
jgi:hypothetical protein